jgi:hypothetical protein
LMHVLGYPPHSEPSASRSLIQVHRACTWSPTYPEGANPFDYRGVVMAHDVQLSIDLSCGQEQLKKAPLRSIQSLSLSGIPLPQKYPDQLAMIEARKSASAFDWFDPKPPKSGEELYKEKAIKALEAAGVFRPIGQSLADACIVREPRYCIESSNVTRIHAFSVLTSEWWLWMPAVLMAIGLLGSILLTPLQVIWVHTGGRLVRWVKAG